MDKIGIRTIVVNFDDEQLPYLSLVQGDAKTRGFDIVICDSDGKEIPPSNDYIVELVATGSNAPDTPYANRHTIEDGKYRVMIPTEALSESGFVFLQLVFYQKSTGAVIHTIEQKCPVYRSRGQEVVESNNLYVDITALRLGLERIDELDSRYESMLGEEKIRQDAEKKRNEQEANRIRDEKTRESNETIRKSQELSRKSAEDKRITAEEERKSNEAQRQKDEKSRLEKEVTRQSEEAERQTAEDKRIADEKTRQSQETTRKSQETARESAEDKRVSSETIRASEEATRKANEVKRESNESTRQSQETERVEAEEERKSKFDGWDKTMEGVIPNATDISTGVVKVDKAEDEEAPYTVPTIGRLEENMSAFEDRITADIQSFKDTTVSENNALKEEINNSVDTKISNLDSKMAEEDSKIKDSLITSANDIRKEMNDLATILHYPTLSVDKTKAPGEKNAVKQVGLEELKKSGVAPKALYPHEGYAFYGEVSDSELISGDDLALKIGLSAGTSINKGVGWLKFMYKGRIQFVAKNGLRTNISWEDINSVNAVYGDKTVEINGLTYKVRLPRGIGEDIQPDPKKLQPEWKDRACHNSEWNTLFAPINLRSPDKWTAYFINLVSTPTAKLSTTYSDAELGGDDTYTLCQETVFSENNRSVRGVSISTGAPLLNKTEMSSGKELVWRPVLELVE